MGISYNHKVTGLLLLLAAADSYTAGAAVTIPATVQLRPEALDALDADPDDITITVTCYRVSDGAVVGSATLARPTVDIPDTDLFTGDVSILAADATAGAYVLVARVTSDVELGEDEQVSDLDSSDEVDSGDIAAVTLPVWLR